MTFKLPICEWRVNLKEFMKGGKKKKRNGSKI